MKSKSLFIRLWGKPILLAAATLIGLLCALLGDGLWDFVSWICLGILVYTVLYYLAIGLRK